MDSYNGSEHGTAEIYMIQGSEPSQHLITAPSLGQFEVMDNEGAPEFIVDQGLYYPAATNYYGYYCTGFESPGEWDDNQRFFGLDSPNLNYAGLQTENLPYVYYTPSYGYAQSPYNPYNPYIPGAVIGVDGSVVGMQQYYTGSTYQHPASSPTYYPLLVQPTENIPSSAQEPHMVNAGASNANGTDGSGLKLNLQQASGGAVKAHPKPALGDGDKTYNQPHTLGKRSEVSKTNVVNNKQLATHTSSAAVSVSRAASSKVAEGRNASGSVQGADQVILGPVPSLQAQAKITMPVTNASLDYGTNARGWPMTDKIRPRFNYGGISNNGNGNPDFYSEQNRGPRTNRSKGQWMPSTSADVYTTNTGTTSANGKIIINADQYNKEDFPVSYVDGKFFVIKSYSEDDVHKSIKYNVWSSTPNGNKRLDSAYQDAQRIAAGNPRGCPVFLFFSVNASGQFVGVAEMIGPVDFNKDMNFWQQDKWNGSFPVKWHIIKDVPNTNFRHIILENNENKPVTNSRDTQEIKYRQGTEMLNIFKSYTLKTSILDDFMYYEERQKIMQEEKAMLHGKSYSSFYIPAFVPFNKPIGVGDHQPCVDETTNMFNIPNSYRRTVATTKEQVSKKPDVPNTTITEEVNTKLNSVENENGAAAVLKIGSLTIDRKPVEPKPTTPVTVATTEAVDVFTVGSKWCFPNSSSSEKGTTKSNDVEGENGVKPVSKIDFLGMDLKPAEAKPVAAVTEAVDVFTVGSMPVKVNGFSEASSGMLTVGSIPIVSKGLKYEKQGVGSSSTGGI